jgi:hypothetical protein
LLDLPFEWALIDAPSLAAQPADSRPFAEHIGAFRGRAALAAFPNLGADADLIVPSEAFPNAHLAAFLRSAPEGQVNALWRRASEASEVWLQGKQAFWVSTSGFGVRWVHVSVDRRPKYYSP